MGAVRRAFGDVPQRHPCPLGWRQVTDPRDIAQAVRPLVGVFRLGPTRSRGETVVRDLTVTSEP